MNNQNIIQYLKDFGKSRGWTKSAKGGIIGRILDRISKEETEETENSMCAICAAKTNVRCFQDDLTMSAMFQWLLDSRQHCGRFRHAAVEIFEYLAMALNVEQRSQSVRGTVLVPVLTAAMYVTHAVERAFPGAQVLTVGLDRKDNGDGTCSPKQYKNNFEDCTNVQKNAVLIEPMWASGGSTIYAVDKAKEAGCERIHVLGALAAPEGIEAITRAHPDVGLYVAEMGEGLDENNYIILRQEYQEMFGKLFGDFGDLCAGRLVAAH